MCQLRTAVATTSVALAGREMESALVSCSFATDPGPLTIVVRGKSSWNLSRGCDETDATQVAATHSTSAA